MDACSVCCFVDNVNAKTYLPDKLINSDVNTANVIRSEKAKHELINLWLLLPYVLLVSSLPFCG